MLTIYSSLAGMRAIDEKIEIPDKYFDANELLEIPLRKASFIPLACSIDRYDKFYPLKF